MTPARFACALATLALLSLGAPAWPQTASAPVRGADALPPTIPLFPLDDIMVFPNIERPLLIFEPRYRAMVADALAGDRIIGMVQLRPGFEADYEGRPPVHAVGCAGVITQAEQLPDGRYTLMLRGLVKFRILGEEQGRAYRVARVEIVPEEPDARELAALRGPRERLLELAVSADDRPPRDVSDEDVINRLAQYLPIGGERRQQLLELNGPLARAEALIRMVETP